MAGTLRFRWADAGDIAAIVALAQSAYRGEASRAGWTTEADFLDGQRIDADGVADMIGRAPGVLLAEHDGRILACCQLRAERDSCWFGLFAVAPGRQGRGIGDRVLAEAERRAACDTGARWMKMQVIWLRESLIDWYRRRGYADTGQIQPFPYGDQRFGIPLRDDLHFIVLAKRLQR